MSNAEYPSDGPIHYFLIYMCWMLQYAHVVVSDGKPIGPTWRLKRVKIKPLDGQMTLKSQIVTPVRLYLENGWR